jgi:hypothetical protein
MTGISFTCWIVFAFPRTQFTHSGAQVNCSFCALPQYLKSQRMVFWLSWNGLNTCGQTAIPA